MGGEKSIPVNTRIIAATNRDLEAEVAAGRFRHDLFHRLNVVSIVIPPLRQRREDIPLISKQLLSKLYVQMELPRLPVILDEAMSTLLNYSWPGNIRELHNALERALTLDSYEISTTTLGLSQQALEEWLIQVSFPKGKSLCDVTKEIRMSLIQEALRRSGGKQNKAAQLLGISRHA